MASFLDDHSAETVKLRIYPDFDNLVDLRADAAVANRNQNEVYLVQKSGV